MAENLPKRPEGKLVWFHVRDAEMLISFRELKLTLLDYLPDLEILVTSEEPIDTSSDDLIDVIHQVLPQDFPHFMRRFIGNWRPDAGVWISDTLYPALMARIAKEGIPVICANAGISRKQGYRYSWFPSFIASYFNCFSRILVRSDKSARRLRWLRAPRRKLEVVGVMSAGAVALPYDEERRLQFQTQLQNRTVWFASYVDPGEVATLAKVQSRMSRFAQRALLILHVADPNEIGSVLTRLSAMGLRVSEESAEDYPSAAADVFVVGNKENLGLFYRLAPVSFVGGSFANTGGNDPFEAAALGSAILHGPSIRNHQNAYDRLTDAGATKLVFDSDSCFKALIAASAPDEAARMAHAAWEVSSSGAGVTDRVLELLAKYLDFELMEFEVESDEAA
ncbi:MAG: glycosyltransferase N-terminal domain-containing protein [Pseudomonadota bacterium]